eukprot:gene20376-26445_t
MTSKALLLLLITRVLLLNQQTEAAFPFWSSSVAENQELADPSDYGVDVSYPIHHYLDRNSFFGKRYYDIMKGCWDKFSRSECEANERARIEMNFDQPRTQHNYTDIGFKKIKAPKELFEPLLKFWEENKDKQVDEHWPRGNTYVNSWSSPSSMVNFENKNLRGGFALKQHIWDHARPILEEWTGKQLVETSLYGIRVYANGSVLATHVDRLPLVSSCIIQVAQDVNEPWPVEVYGRDGKAYNVTMEPGDMVLYESHTTLHGRPFPLNGSYYANIFVHFSPIDHDQENERDESLRQEKLRRPPTSDTVFAGAKILKDTLDSVRSRIGGHEQENHDENAIKRFSVKGQTALHVASSVGDFDKVIDLMKDKPTDLLHARDENGWQAIHEAARGGHSDIVKYLIELGADMNAETKSGETPLDWAIQSLHDGHEVIRYLQEIGAKEADMLD